MFLVQTNPFFLVDQLHGQGPPRQAAGSEGQFLSIPTQRCLVRGGFQGGTHAVESESAAGGYRDLQRIFLCFEPHDLVEGPRLETREDGAGAYLVASSFELISIERPSV